MVNTGERYCADIPGMWACIVFHSPVWPLCLTACLFAGCTPTLVRCRYTGTQVATLPNGRNVSYVDGGDMSGPVLVFWHGTPGCRASYRHVLEPVAKRCGLRLITIDRPGVGLTTPLPHTPRNVMDNVADVGPLLAKLGVSKFCVAGQSGGGPHVLGCMSLYAATQHTQSGPVCVAGFITGGPGDMNHPSATRKMMCINRTAKWFAQ